jgi:DNA polymerase
MDEGPARIEQRLQTAIRQKLLCLHQAGVQQLGKTPSVLAPPPPAPAEEDTTAAAPPGSSSRNETAAPPAAGTRQPAEPRERPAAPSPSPSKSQQDSPAAASAPSLEALRPEVAACTLCRDLVSNRTQTVFGVGDPNARLCFLGEAPGADEDRQGEPFVGKAGQLLDRIIAACTLRREQVYILNVLKCRPPGNRTPAPDEVANCRFFFERQLELIAPEFICCLGAVAAQSLLQTTQSVGRLRGRFHEYRNSKVVVTYHPAYLLRSPDQKRKTWDDMKMLMAAMGIEIPKR